ncbi:uncharacterized protein PG998_012221 [Apiospora kogelbergensis]|uniref:uncharacterized protein n=1 Tax=Apiospora kogelbergensis TaxID=1337665 RepID=UPI003130F8B9
MDFLGGITDTFTPRDAKQFGDVRDIQLVVSAICKLVMRPARLHALRDTVGRDIRDRDFRAWICC